MVENNMDQTMKEEIEEIRESINGDGSNTKV